MFVRSTVKQYCQLFLALQLLLACLAEEVVAPSEVSCEEPKEPLIVLEVFEQYSNKESLTDRKTYKKLDANSSFKKGTTIVVDCKPGYTAFKGSFSLECGLSNAWNGSFPQCVPNVCWWLGHEIDIEFRYKGMLLTERHRGFPGGTELTFLRKSCQVEKPSNKPLMRCSSTGQWEGYYPGCMAQDRKWETTDESTPSEEDESKSFISWMLLWTGLISVTFMALILFLVIACYKMSKAPAGRARPVRNNRRYDDASSPHRANTSLLQEHSEGNNASENAYEVPRQGRVGDGYYITVESGVGRKDLQIYAQPVDRPDSS